MFQQPVKMHPRIQYPSSPASLFAAMSRMERHPSFRTLHGRDPIPGLDFDPAAPLSQDDRDFLSGSGIYSEER